MGDFGAKPETGAGPAAEVWRKTLQRIPTQFGRLHFLASLRDVLTGEYSHPPLSQLVGREITDRTLRHSHHEIFARWLSLSLERQKADLDEYLASSGAPAELSAYRALAPATAHQVEQQLYLTDLETLLELVRFENAEASGNRTAWPRR